MSQPAIRVQNLGKQYRIGGARAPYRTLRESISDAVTAPVRGLARRLRSDGAAAAQNTIWALKEVSFDIDRGEVVGVIGRNGAGKTTLLKILSRITKPTEGSVDLYGRVGSLLEVGTGFHPELTGEENIYLNGSILGMTRSDIASKFDQIVEFAETEKFINTPVKHYSSGMYLRLAFSVAAHLETDIVLVDEVLAVGDAAFQKKCLGKMGEVATAGRTVLFVSHNMAAITELCPRTMLIEEGQIVDFGPSSQVVESYLDTVHHSMATRLADRKDRLGAGTVRFTDIETRVDGEPTSVIQHGTALEIRANYQTDKSLDPRTIRFSVSFVSAQNVKVLALDSGEDFENAVLMRPNGSVTCRVPEFPLLRGKYRGVVYCEVNGIPQDRIEDAFAIEVLSGKYPMVGYVSVDHEWTYS